MDIDARLGDLRRLREHPSVEAAQDLLGRWADEDNLYDARSTGWRAER